MFGIDDGLMAGVIGGGTNILGGLLGQGANRQAMRAGYDFQREVDKNQLQWRMQDAKKAGLHPLAAMGMMPTGSQPVAIGGDVLSESMARAGQSFSSGISSTERGLENAQIELLKAQKDKTLMETEALRPTGVPGSPNIVAENSGGGSVPTGQTPRADLVSNYGIGVPYVNAPPPTVIPYGMRGPGIEAGVAQDLEEVTTPEGLNLMVPASKKQEGHMEMMKDMTWPMLLSLALRNQNYWSKKGYDNWWDDAIRVASGFDPKGPIKTTHAGMIPPSAIEALVGAFQFMVPKAKKTYDYATNEASAYMNRYKRWSRSHPSGRR